MSRYRKAIAAGLSPLVALPLGTWGLHAIDNSIPLQEPFSWRTVITAAVVGVQSAYLVWQFPNATADPDIEAM